MRGDRTSLRAARMPGSSARRKRNPCRTAMPRSNRKARIWLMMPLRWLTNRSRTRCSACKSSCSAVLVATNFIIGRCTASAIASASRKSFFCPFEYQQRLATRRAIKAPRLAPQGQYQLDPGCCRRVVLQIRVQIGEARI
jgi:hypothetical protein